MAENTKEGLFNCDFEIRGVLPKEAFELFAVTQAKLVGLRGFLTQTADDLYRGVIQGESKLIEKFRRVIEAASEFMGNIKEIVMKNFKSISAYTYETFDIKRKEN